MVSAASAVITYSTLVVVYGVLNLWTEVPSALFANVVATVPNYFLSRRWVWGKDGSLPLLAGGGALLGHVADRDGALDHDRVAGTEVQQ